MSPSFLAPSALLARVQERLFDRVTIDAGWEPAVRAAARRGTVVYALRTSSIVDFLALGGLARRLGLPPVALGDDITPVADLPGPLRMRWAAGDAAARLDRSLSAGRRASDRGAPRRRPPPSASSAARGDRPPA